LLDDAQSAEAIGSDRQELSETNQLNVNLTVEISEFFGVTRQAAIHIQVEYRIRFVAGTACPLYNAVMPLEILVVDAYSGYRANERPQRFAVDEEIYEIASIEDQWRLPEAMFFKVRSTEVNSLTRSHTNV